MFIKSLLLILILVNHSQQKLQFVVELFRHGSREMVYDIFQDNTTAVIEGALTPTGMRQHFLLGATLRKRYVDELQFLQPNYNESEFRVISTDVNRTIQSAQSQLYGFYPEGYGPEIFNTQLQDVAKPPFPNITYPYRRLGLDALPHKYGPIPIHTTDGSNLMPFWWIEPWFIQKSNEQKATPYYQNLLKEFEPTFDTLRTQLNKTVDQLNDFSHVYQIYDNQICEYYKGNPFNPLFQGELLKNMTFMFNFNIQFQYLSTREMKRVSSTKHFERLLSLFQLKLEKKDPLKWQMISCHDSDIANLASSLNFTSHECIYESFKQGHEVPKCIYDYPSFASNILVELHQNDQDNSYYIKVLYDGVYRELCEKDSFECGFDEFQQRLEYSLLNATVNNKPNYQINSSLRMQQFENLQKQNNELFAIISILSIVCLGLLIVLLKKGSKRTQELDRYENFGQSNVY